MARTVAGTTPGRTNRKFLIVALLFGAVTAALFYAVTARSSGSTAATTRALPGDVQVVVAKAPIKQRTTITPDMLEVKSISTSSVIGGAFTTINDAVGKVTKFPIEANEQVIASSVVDPAKPATGAALSLVVPTGRRAMSIQASQVLSAGGLILPGDYVDLVWSCCDKTGGRTVATKTLIRDVQVAAVAQDIVNSGPVTSKPQSGSAGGTSSDSPVAADPGKPVPDAVTMTLLLTPDEAQLVFLAEATGTLRADLRGLGDQDTPDTGITLFTQLIPPDALKSLPPALRPDFAQ